MCRKYQAGQEEEGTPKWEKKRKSENVVLSSPSPNIYIIWHFSPQIKGFPFLETLFCVSLQKCCLTCYVWFFFSRVAAFVLLFLFARLLQPKNSHFPFSSASTFFLRFHLCASLFFLLNCGSPGTSSHFTIFCLNNVEPEITNLHSFSSCLLFFHQCAATLIPFPPQEPSFNTGHQNANSHPHATLSSFV